MKKLLLLSLLIGMSMTAQNKYLTKTGTINFEASVPSFEEVAAENNSVTAIINTENGELAALALLKGFRFKNALMEEHFNENYAESDQFPKATFKGHIKDFNLNDFKPTYTIKGELEFHGKTKTIENTSVAISYENNRITISGNFSVKASEFDIDIPKIVSNKIAERIDITFVFKLQSK